MYFIVNSVGNDEKGYISGFSKTDFFESFCGNFINSRGKLTRGLVFFNVKCRKIVL